MNESTLSLNAMPKIQLRHHQEMNLLGLRLWGFHLVANSQIRVALFSSQICFPVKEQPTQAGSHHKSSWPGQVATRFHFPLPYLNYLYSIWTAQSLILQQISSTSMHAHLLPSTIPHLRVPSPSLSKYNSIVQDINNSINLGVSLGTPF